MHLFTVLNKNKLMTYKTGSGSIKQSTEKFKSASDVLREGSMYSGSIM